MVPSAEILTENPLSSAAASPSISAPNIRHILLYVGGMNPVFDAGGDTIALPRVVADNVVVVGAIMAVGLLISVQTLPFSECATWPPLLKTPVSGSVNPTPVATHVATPDASTPHVTSVPETAKIPRPVPAAQFAPSYE